MAQIFISYAREDEETAVKIHDSLVSEGHSVWMDRKKLIPGQDWKTEIEQAIQSSDIFIACLSTHSVDKVGFVQAELRRALDVADLMPEGKIFIIPVRLDECQVPTKLKKLQWVNHFEIGSGESLLRAVRTRSDVEKELEKAITDFLIRDSPDGISERFSGVLTANLSKALLSIAKKVDELALVRKRAVRGLANLNVLNPQVWSEILPYASTELFQEWLPMWGQDSDTTVLTEEHIRIMLEGKRLPKSTTGFGKAVRKFMERGTGYTSAVFLPGKNYPAWEVKHDCVRTIIQLDDRDSMRTLSAFSTMSYWKARRNIIDYIEGKLKAGSLSSDDKKYATGILKQIISDGKTDEKTPTMRMAKELRDQLRTPD
jgi:hypothetical protein